MTELQLYPCVDWDRNEFVCRDADIGDPVNLFGAVAARPEDLRLQRLEIIQTQLFPDSYGKWEMTWGTLTQSPSIGYDGTAYDVAVTPGSVYSAAVWLRRNNNGSGSVSVSLVDTAGTVATVSTTAIIDTAYTQVAVSGTVSGTAAYIALHDPTLPQSYLMFATGPMIVAGTVVPDGFNCGTLSLYENLRPYTIDARWNTGFTAPYKYVSDLERCTLTLNNRSKMFSPENTSSPLAGHLKSDYQLWLYGKRGSQWEHMLLAWIDSINPLPGNNGPKTATIEASGGRRFFEGKEPYVSIVLNATALEIVGHYLDSINYPGFTFAPLLPPMTPEPWRRTYPYAPDNYDETQDILDIIADVTGAEQGKFYLDRGGTAQFRYPHQIDRGGTLHLDNTFITGQYSYGDKIENAVSVMQRRRRVSSGTADLLWQQDGTLTLDPYEIDTIRALFRDPTVENVKVSALNPYLTYTAERGVGATLATPSAQSVEIVIQNTRRNEKNVTAMEVRGKKITTFDEVKYMVVDSASISEHGDHAALYDFRIVSARAHARNLANVLLERFSAPRGAFKWVLVKALQSDAIAQAILTTKFGARIRVTDDQTDHDDYYTVIGEMHAVDTALKDWDCTWILEPLYGVWTLDDPALGRLDHNLISPV